jgi:hypothetical protein
MPSLNITRLSGCTDNSPTRCSGVSQRTCHLTDFGTVRQRCCTHCTYSVNYQIFVFNMYSFARKVTGCTVRVVKTMFYCEIVIKSRNYVLVYDVIRLLRQGYINHFFCLFVLLVLTLLFRCRSYTCCVNIAASHNTVIF